MEPKKGETYVLSKVSSKGRCEVRFKLNRDGTVTYATIENGRTAFSGKLPDWEAASKAWDNLVSKGYAKENELYD